MINNITAWKNELGTYLTELNQQLKQNEDCQKIYYGFEVFDGAVKTNPYILFIGTHPTGNEENRHFEVKMEIEPFSYLTEKANDFKFDAAKNTKLLLQKSGIKRDKSIKNLLENKVVKTNLFHIVTNNEHEIKDCLVKCKVDYETYWATSVRFCVALIDILQPKIVILEGKSTFQSLIEEGLMSKNAWNKVEDYGYYFDQATTVHYIGYSKNYSSINSIGAVAEQLAVALKSNS